MIEALIILASLFALGVVGTMEKFMISIGTGLILLALTAAFIGLLVSLKRTMRR